MSQQSTTDQAKQNLGSNPPTRPGSFTVGVPAVHARRVNVDGLSVFYREAGSPENPTLVLLHGYPSSSFMFRELMRRLADRFHLVAPDFPGFGNTETPPPTEFSYTFDHLAEVTGHLLETLGLEKYSLYVQDYGAPVGFRLAVQHPERIQALVVQNGNAYEEGFSPAWAPFRALWANRNPETEAGAAALYAPKITQFFYTEGTREPGKLNPDAWNMDQFFIDRPVNQQTNMELFYDYRNNPANYAEWQAYFRQHQPPTLIVWGQGDPFFTVEGAKAFLRDLPKAEFHLLNTGHFALEEEGQAIADHIRRFLPTALRAPSAEA